MHFAVRVTYTLIIDAAGKVLKEPPLKPLNLETDTMSPWRSYSDSRNNLASPPFIAVYGSSSPKFPRLSPQRHTPIKTSPGSSRPNTPEIKVTRAPIAMTSEPLAGDGSAEIEPREENREVQQMVQVAMGSSEGDFISPEAQKLAGEILKETEFEDSALSGRSASKEGSTFRKELQATGQEESTKEAVGPEESTSNEESTTVREGDTGEEVTIRSEPTNTEPMSTATDGNAVEQETVEAKLVSEEVAEVPPDEANNMAARSSTILFVDMSNLSLQQGNTNT